MNLRQLETFRAVVECRSFSAAAARLFIAQSAVSIAVRKLEDDLGVTLFDRRERRATLTDAGRVLLRHAEHIHHAVAETRLELGEMQGLARGAVRFGVPAMLASYFFPAHFTAFQRKYPGLTLQIHEEGTQRIQELLEERRIDIGIVSMDRVKPSLQATPLITEEMLAYVPRRHRFARRRAIRFQEFAGEALILYKRGYFLREIVDQLSERQGVETNIKAETNLVELMKHLVKDDIGIGVCLRSVLGSDKTLIGVPFRPAIRLRFGIAHRKGAYLSMANQAFLEFLVQHSLKGPE